MSQQEHWKSKIGFILAAAGSAIGLGAIWKFPDVVETGGGGAFLLPFLVFTLLLGFPQYNWRNHARSEKSKRRNHDL